MGKKKLDFTDFNNIKKLIEEKQYVMILGAGGVGKSTNINLLVDYFENINKEVIKCGTTGISAFNIQGVTINSFLGFADTNSIEEFDVWVKEQNKKSAKFDFEKYVKYFTKRVSKVDLLVIDEISMISANKWDLISYLLNKYDFNGRIILSGDVFQLPPIGSKSKYLDNIKNDSKFFFESQDWKNFNFVPYILEKVYRTNDLEFQSHLSKVRFGKIDNSSFNYLKKMFDNENVKKLNPTVIASLKDDVFDFNKKKLAEIKSKTFVKKFDLEFEKYEYKDDYEEKVLNFVSSQLQIEKKLFIKVGALILFTSNCEDEYFNGEKGIITNIFEDLIRVKKTNGVIVNVCRKSFEYLSYIGNEIKSICKITQFPIKLGYAITYHKSQGMSIDNIVLNVNNLFCKGQFYVGISRATNPNGVLLISRNKESFGNVLKSNCKVEQKLLNFYSKANKLQIKC